MAMPKYTLPQIEQALRDLPRPRFRAQLKADLERMATMITDTTGSAEAGRHMTETERHVTQTASPRLRLKNAAAAIEFYKEAFGAREIMRFTGHGRIAHAELVIDIKDGGRGFTCRDLEGHVWSFGTYRPGT